jgi:hypothetical protein
MKKILAVTLICTMSAFAAWDKFPVIEHGKGEAKFSWETGSQGSKPLGESDEFYGIRFSPIADLEFAAFANDNYTLGLRYQIISVLSAGVDVSFPLPGAYWSFTPSIQFSMPLTSALTLGSNFEATINTAGEYVNSYYEKETKGIDATAGIELDFALNEKNTVWISCDLIKGLTRTKQDDEKISRKTEGRGLGIYPALGYLITLGNLELGTYLKLGFGEDASYNGKYAISDEISTVTGIDAAIKF